MKKQKWKILSYCKSFRGGTATGATEIWWKRYTGGKLCVLVGSTPKTITKA